MWALPSALYIPHSDIRGHLCNYNTKAGSLACSISLYIPIIYRIYRCYEKQRVIPVLPEYNCWKKLHGWDSLLRGVDSHVSELLVNPSTSWTFSGRTVNIYFKEITQGKYCSFLLTVACNCNIVWDGTLRDRERTECGQRSVLANDLQSLMTVIENVSK